MRDGFVNADSPSSMAKRTSLASDQVMCDYGTLTCGCLMLH